MSYHSECKEMVARLDEMKESELSDEEEKIYQDAVCRINRLYEICARYEKGV
jgi:demethoxyubiquinone hydroxylase (CLK1/Coq7/Cat5 family)